MQIRLIPEYPDDPVRTRLVSLLQETINLTTHFSQPEIDRTLMNMLDDYNIPYEVSE